jgi:methionine-gamma-lyase
VHGGERPDKETGASSPNIVMSSTFVVDAPLSFSAESREHDAPYVYGRWGNPTVRQLEDKLTLLEEGEACVCFASGMAATSALFLSLLTHGDHVIMSDVNYPGTAELARNSLPRFGIEVTMVDSGQTEQVAEALRPNTRLVWIETPANPILRLTDIQAIAELTHSVGAELAVDSTFASPIATRPITLGADYVVHSLTKYIGGHGDAMGGAIIGSKAGLEKIDLEGQVHLGGIISPFNAWLILRGAATLPIRMQAHEKNAMHIAEFLEQHSKVSTVRYPGLASHPQHELACRQMDNFSGMISIQVPGGRDVAARMMQELSIFHYAVSLGHHRSLIFWIGTEDLVKNSFKLEGKALADYRAWAGDGVFRLSIGLEDAEDLCADLDQVLSG